MDRAATAELYWRLGLYRIARRLACHPIECIEQSFAPRVDRIVLLEQFERADDARPLEAAEHDVISIVRRVTAEIGLCPQRQPHRLERFAKADDGSVAAGHRFLKRLAQSRLAALAKIIGVDRPKMAGNVGHDQRKDAADNGDIAPS